MAIIVFSILPSVVIHIYPDFSGLGVFSRKLIMVISRIIFIPVIAGLAYEALKLSSRFKDNSVVAAINQPGLMFQRVTTKEPGLKQIEVALKAFRSVE